MTEVIEVHPITRLEGHGKIEIILNEHGEVDRAYLSIPELRGFEIFARGRPAEIMPQLTARICGVCPTAHHMASAKALDDLYGVSPPPAARKIRELLYNMFMFEDHLLHIYILGGPDFIVGPDAPKALRNVVGVIQKVGVEVATQLIAMRRQVRELMTLLAGKVIHPVLALPGGVSRGIHEEERTLFVNVAQQAVDFARFTLDTFRNLVLKNSDYLEMILSDVYYHETYYMGLVDDQNRVNFYDGQIRVVNPEGKEVYKFPVSDYQKYLAEHVEPWTYVKFLFLKEIGWQGFTEGKNSGIYAVAPLARLNVADGMATTEAQAAYEEYVTTLEGKPVHYTLAMHWARVVEAIQAAEAFLHLSKDPEICSEMLRNPIGEPRGVGIGVVEAPRGTLIHHYETDGSGLITRANLLVATQNNAARIAMSVDKAARTLVHDGKVSEELLNKVEMAFRAYDPCFACATHALPGSVPLEAVVRNSQGDVIHRIANF